jgi:hypothetical protein
VIAISGGFSRDDAQASLNRCHQTIASQDWKEAFTAVQRLVGYLNFYGILNWFGGVEVRDSSITLRGVENRSVVITDHSGLHVPSGGHRQPLTVTQFDEVLIETLEGFIEYCDANKRRTSKMLDFMREQVQPPAQ